MDGLFGSPLLRPEALFGLTGLQPVSHALFWSITANLLLLVGGSLLFQQDNLQRLQALLFVNIFEREGTTRIWRGDTRVAELHELLLRFIGREQAEHVLATDAYRRGHRLAMEERADADFVQLGAARGLAIGAARRHGESRWSGRVTAGRHPRILDEASQVTVQPPAEALAGARAGGAGASRQRSLRSSTDGDFPQRSATSSDTLTRSARSRRSDRQPDLELERGFSHQWARGAADAADHNVSTSRDPIRRMDCCVTSTWSP